LVCEGIDTVSSIEVNSVHIGKTDNQFRRYIFELNNLKEENTIKFKFTSAIKYTNEQKNKYPYPGIHFLT
jgi:hypothetical protein